MRDYWGIHLNNGGKKIVMPFMPEELKEKNEEGFDIYCTANDVVGHGMREKKDLRRINAFFVDLDEGTKQEQMACIRSGPIPTSINETGRGYQVFFVLDNPLDIEESEAEEKSNWFREFQKSRLVPFYNADMQACDATRVLRVPGYRYWKDGKGTFVIKNVLKTERRFNVKSLEKLFPVKGTVEEKKEHRTYAKTFNDSENIWVKANNYSVVEALSRVSGSRWCNGETFSLLNEGNGRQRILVNGKSSNAWVDASGRIGSLETGRDGISVAGTIVNWLGYYKHDMKTIAEILKEVL